MRDDVFSAALKATARVAFSVAVVAGCSAADEPTATGSNESEVKTAKSPNAPKSPDAPKPCTKDAGPAPTCGEHLDALEAAYDKWLSDVTGQWDSDGGVTEEPTAPVVSADTKQCCHDELAADGFQAAHRRACCQFAYTWQEAIDAKDDGIAMACTPWGPPVPPAMTVLA